MILIYTYKIVYTTMIIDFLFESTTWGCQSNLGKLNFMTRNILFYWVYLYQQGACKCKKGALNDTKT
jgi:hypothetical protein